MHCVRSWPKDNNWVFIQGAAREFFLGGVQTVQLTNDALLFSDAEVASIRRIIIAVFFLIQCLSHKLGKILIHIFGSTAKCGRSTCFSIWVQFGIAANPLLGFS